VSDSGRSVRVRRSWYARRRRVRRTVLVLATLGITYLGAWWAFSVRSSWLSRTSPDQADLKWAQGNLSHNLALLATESVASPLSLPRQVVYPYSVIPGGIQTPEDLRQVSEHDRLVGSHYAGFDFRNARIVELDQPKLVYLSYRMGGKLFWTGKKISLHKGERLITDGRMTARARCANRISENAQPAVSPAEPPAANFEQPFDGTAGRIPFPGDFNGLGPAREFPGLGAQGPPGLQSVNSPSFAGGGLPPVFPPPIPSKGCPPGEVAGTNHTCHHHKPPPPAVPEPATMLLVSSGMAGIYWRRRKAAAKK
jgi:hypothetical protein